MNEKKYEEICRVYRFFLGWRHASFAGNLIVLYGVVSLCISAHKDADALTWVIPLAASPLGVLLYCIDLRTRDQYHCAIRAGEKLESKSGGFFTELSEVVLPPNTSPFKRVTQSSALNIFASSAESVGRFEVNSSSNARIHPVFRAIGQQMNLDIRNREGTNLPFFDVEIA